MCMQYRIVQTALGWLLYAQRRTARRLRRGDDSSPRGCRPNSTKRVAVRPN